MKKKKTSNKVMLITSDKKGLANSMVYDLRIQDENKPAMQNFENYPSGPWDEWHEGPKEKH